MSISKALSISRIGRAAAVGLALAGVGLVVAAGTASADTGDDNQGNGGPQSAASESSVLDGTATGVPVTGAVKSATGATKVLPGGQQGPGY